MLFSIEKTLNCVRLGLINGVERLPSFNMETPNLFVYMKGGVIPYLTPDVFEDISKESGVLYFPLSGIIHCRETLRKYCGNIGDFVGMPNYLTFASVIDSGVKRKPGHNVRNHVPVWSKTGKVEVNSETYLDLMEAMKPDLFLTLSDTDTELNSSKRRISKSLERSLDFFNKCLISHKSSEKLKKSKIIGSLVGGFSTEVREICSSNIGQSSVFGISIDGLHDCSEEVSLIDFKCIKAQVEASLKHVTSDKLRICHGSWNPKVVLDLISLGVDILDTSFPCMIAEDGGALTFINDESTLVNIESAVLKSNNENFNNFQDKSANFSYNGTSEPVNKKPKMVSEYSQFHISLKNEEYAECLEPISISCSCLTCKNHTKAYIHHLLNVKELLGTTLLMMPYNTEIISDVLYETNSGIRNCEEQMIEARVKKVVGGTCREQCFQKKEKLMPFTHNLHHYFYFFKTIRTALKEDKFEIMKRNFDIIFGKDHNS